eukprot:TRINITY_DN67800_c12_g2_i1.p1 TRINITY_DN67800_c12_g2~~TRINITY_DN67800_c12_g2_i1.p1  ORF type:complete len:154 (+),score=6.13 TRINITY_DN67800_c12_g2_i1:67-528(+)
MRISETVLCFKPSLCVCGAPQILWVVCGAQIKTAPQISFCHAANSQPCLFLKNEAYFTLFQRGIFRNSISCLNYNNTDFFKISSLVVSLLAGQVAQPHPTTEKGLEMPSPAKKLADNVALTSLWHPYIFSPIHTHMCLTQMALHHSLPTYNSC